MPNLFLKLLVTINVSLKNESKMATIEGILGANILSFVFDTYKLLNLSITSN